MPNLEKTTSIEKVWPYEEIWQLNNGLKVRVCYGTVCCTPADEDGEKWSAACKARLFLTKCYISVRNAVRNEHGDIVPTILKEFANHDLYKNKELLFMPMSYYIEIEPEKLPEYLAHLESLGGIFLTQGKEYDDEDG